MVKPFARSLVMGKFYPPHRGHEHLIRTAAAQSSLVHVLVIYQPGQIPGPAQRVSWLRAHFAGSQVMVRSLLDLPCYDDDAAWARYFALQVRHELPRHYWTPEYDAVFSSEDYGALLGHEFSAQVVNVDPDRSAHAISARTIRADPAAHLDWLLPPARDWYQWALR